MGMFFLFKLSHPTRRVREHQRKTCHELLSCTNWWQSWALHSNNLTECDGSKRGKDVMPLRCQALPGFKKSALPTTQWNRAIDDSSREKSELKFTKKQVTLWTTMQHEMQTFISAMGFTISWFSNTSTSFRSFCTSTTFFPGQSTKDQETAAYKIGNLDSS